MIFHCIQEDDQYLCTFLQFCHSKNNTCSSNHYRTSSFTSATMKVLFLNEPCLEQRGALYQVLASHCFPPAFHGQVGGTENTKLCKIAWNHHHVLSHILKAIYPNSKLKYAHCQHPHTQQLTKCLHACCGCIQGLVWHENVTKSVHNEFCWKGVLCVCIVRGKISMFYL